MRDPIYPTLGHQGLRLPHHHLSPQQNHAPPPTPAAAAVPHVAPTIMTGTGVGSSYKELKEAWIANQSGSSIFRINLFGLTMVSTFILWAAFRSRKLRFAPPEELRHPSSIPNPALRALLAGIAPMSDWMLEFFLLVFPAICANTVLSGRLVLVNLTILLLSAFIYYAAAEPLPSNRATSDKGKAKESGSNSATKRRHWSKRSSDDDDEDDEPLDIDHRLAAASMADPPIRVSVDSAADAAHAAAAPPTMYSWPDSSPDSDTASYPPTSSRNSIASEGGTGPAGPSSATTSPISPLARNLIDPLRSVTGTPTPPAPNTQDNKTLFVRPQPFLTVYRSHMMLLTVICILAVDFPAFPRDFSKCETWGTSLMDMGVGSFVFSLGIVSALPFLRSPRNRFNSLRGQLMRDVRRSLPLILLGSVRVMMVKGVEYPEHVSEYGVHWNFFFTLALLPFAATLSRPLCRFVRFSTLGLVLSLLHQLLLLKTELLGWAIADLPSRAGESLLTQNKEGLTSMPGYLAIFLLGLDAGHYVLPLDPYFAYRKLRRRRAKPKTAKLAMVLASFAVIWWAAYAALGVGGLQTSRRLANLPYVIWVAAFNTSFLLGYVLVYLVFQTPAPALLDHMNRHSLAVFLIANLLTGLVNVSIETMYTRDAVALVILTAYTAACCGSATLFTQKGWRLKL